MLGREHVLSAIAKRLGKPKTIWVKYKLKNPRFSPPSGSTVLQMSPFSLSTSCHRKLGIPRHPASAEELCSLRAPFWGSWDDLGYYDIYIPPFLQHGGLAYLRTYNPGISKTSLIPGSSSRAKLSRVNNPAVKSHFQPYCKRSLQPGKGPRTFSMPSTFWSSFNTMSRNTESPSCNYTQPAGRIEHTGCHGEAEAGTKCKPLQLLSTSIRTDQLLTLPANESRTPAEFHQRRPLESRRPGSADTLPSRSCLNGAFGPCRAYRAFFALISSPEGRLSPRQALAQPSPLPSVKNHPLPRPAKPPETRLGDAGTLIAHSPLHPPGIQNGGAWSRRLRRRASWHTREPDQQQRPLYKARWSRERLALWTVETGSSPLTDVETRHNLPRCVVTARKQHPEQPTGKLSKVTGVSASNRIGLLHLEAGPMRRDLKGLVDEKPMAWRRI